MSEKRENERENREKGENSEGEKRENRENEETLPKIPDEWASIPFQDYFDRGFRPYKHRVREKEYMALRKGKEFKSLGPYDEERWNLLVNMYPYKLPQPSPDNPPIDERIEELKKEKLGKREIAQALYEEGYSTQEMMHNGYPPSLLAGRSKRKLSDEDVQAAVRGATRGPGYLQELKSMIQKQISLSREFAESCTTAGVKVLFAALKRGSVSEEDISRITRDVGALENVVDKATQTALKAIEYYNVEHIKQLEEERNEARVAYSLAVAQLKDQQRRLEPRKSLERLIYTYIVSGNTDGNVLTTLIDKLLTMEMGKVQSEVLA